MGTNLHQLFDTLTPTDLFASAKSVMRYEGKSTLVAPRSEPLKARLRRPTLHDF